MTDVPLPWVLLQKGFPPSHFATRELAQKFYDTVRFNRGAALAGAALFGPGGEAWYCRRTRHDQWVRDDERRKRQALAEETAA